MMLFFNSFVRDLPPLQRTSRILKVLQRTYYFLLLVASSDDAKLNKVSANAKKHVILLTVF